MKLCDTSIKFRIKGREGLRNLNPTGRWRLITAEESQYMTVEMTYDIPRI